MSLPRHAALLVNGNSRRGADWYLQALNSLEGSHIQLIESCSFKRPNLLAAAASRLIGDGVPMVIVGGGDGTLSSVAPLFAHTNTILGVLPMGTGNAFARDLEVPASIDGAVEVLLNGKIAKVDLARIGGRCFLNVASVGLTTKIALGLNHESKKIFGKAAYVASIIKALATLRSFKVLLTADGERNEFESLMLVIGNGRYHAGSLLVASDASICSGYLSIYALASRRKIDLLRMALYLRGGKQGELETVKAFRVQSGRLATTPPRRITVDGEICLSTPADFTIEPGALRVAVPSASTLDASHP